MNGEIVVDASIAIKWMVDEADSLWARTLPAPGLRLIAPELLLSEYNSALWKFRRRGLLRDDLHLALLDRLAAFDLHVPACPPALHRTAVTRAAALPADRLLTPPAPA